MAAGILLAGNPVQSRTCTIPFPVGGWQTIRSADVTGGLFPPGLHRNYPGDLNWLLSLQTVQGNQLYIPAEEYFTWCYGASQEVRRVLTTYNFAEVVHERLYAPPDPEQEKECGPGIWPIRLRQKMTKADAVMLAYAKFTDHGYKTLASVHNQLRHQFTNMTRKAIPAFIKIIPWHQENFRLTVTGLPFNDRQSFLHCGLRVHHHRDVWAILLNAVWTPEMIMSFRQMQTARQLSTAHSSAHTLSLQISSTSPTTRTPTPIYRKLLLIPPASHLLAIPAQSGIK
ncbi:Uncharacterised protein [Serratia rubidaea]|uniref:Uncharacterized protein n=1 Tax=Serratia rubidaea TaxID=61652 RepID=A0A3S4JR69_SERRU|nr:Uncharacterised protein [Serratia rubidaea]